MGGTVEVVGLVWIGFAIAFVLAQFKLFSIDRTLKEISKQLKAIVPAPVVASSGVVPEVTMVPKEVWACKNCNYATSIDRDKPARCGYCGAKDFEKKIIQVKADTV